MERVKSKKPLKTLYALLLLFASTFAQAQFPEPEDFPDQTIAELIQIGGQPTGVWYMDGMPWPLDELLNRPQLLVLSAALDCLEQKDPALNAHAFCVQLLLRLAPDNLDQLLLKSFPSLNDRGQYEVLLYGHRYSPPEFSPLFVSAVQGVMSEEEPSKVSGLAALYGLRVYDPALLGVLIQYYESHETALKELNSLYLDGFPYSDVVFISAENPNDLFEESILFGQKMQEELTRQMTVEEEYLREEIWNSVFEPPRFDLPLRQRTLEELISDMNNVADSLLLDWEGESDSFVLQMPTNVGGKNQTASDLLAMLCNQVDLQISSDSEFSGRWKLSSAFNYSENLVENGCVSYMGFLVSFRALFTRRESATIAMQVDSGGIWPRYSSKEFILDEMVFQNGEKFKGVGRIVKSVPGFFKFPAEVSRLSDLGVISFRGKVTVSLPEKLHLIRHKITSGQEFSLVSGPFELEYQEDKEKVLVSWGVRQSCCGQRETGSASFDEGKVVLTGKNGEIIGQRGSMNTFRELDQLNTNIYLPYSSKRFSQPEELSWVFSPLMKPVSFDIEFKQVRFYQNPYLDGKISRQHQAISHVRDFPENWDESAFQIFESGLNDTESAEVRSFLARLTTILERKKYLEKYNDQLPAIQFPDTLKIRVRELMSADDSDVALSAAVTYLLIGPITEDLENLILTRFLDNDEILSNSRHSNTISKMIAVMSESPVLSEEFELWLLNTVENDTFEIRLAAATAFSRKENVPAALLGKLVAFVERPESYANTNILSLIHGEFRAEWIPYRNRLERMRSRVAEEMNLPEEERMLQIRDPRSSLYFLDEILN